MTDWVQGADGLEIYRSYFNMSQKNIFTCQAGYIYPIYQMLVLPNDLIKIRNECIVRQNPMIAPTYTNYKVKFYDIFVALRALDKKIYRFMSGFEEYTKEKQYTGELPKWKPNTLRNSRITGAGTLWDFLENPINTLPLKYAQQLDYYRQAYGYTWDMKFRNETRQKSILIDGEPGSWTGEGLLRINVDRDYFSTSLPSQQLGDPVGIPIGLSWDFNKVFNTDNWTQISNGALDGGNGVWANALVPRENQLKVGWLTTISGEPSEKLKTLANTFNKVAESTEANSLILISKMKEAIALQGFGEINAIAGIRDDEFLRAHYGIAPTDENLLYPIVIDRSEMNLLTSVIHQMSETNTTPLGEMAGTGLGVGNSSEATYHAKEYGIYLKLMAIKYDTTYSNQGIKAEYTQNSKFDFPLPILQALSYQPLFRQELITDTMYLPYADKEGLIHVDGKTGLRTIDQVEASDKRIIGYQEPFAWAKEKRDRIAGGLNLEMYYKKEDIEGKTNITDQELENMEIQYKYNNYNWAQTRFFSFKPSERPLINNDFLQFYDDGRNYAGKENIKGEMTFEYVSKEVDEDGNPDWTQGEIPNINYDQFTVWHNNIVNTWRNIRNKNLPSMLGLLGS